MKKVIMFSVFFSFSLFAEEHKHNLHAHEHGSVKLEVAVEKNKLTLNLDTPAEALLGFEHEAKTAKEKKIWTDLQKNWSETKKYFSVDESADCILKSAEMKREVTDGEKTGHSDLTGSVSYECKNSLEGKKLKVMLKKEFKNIKDLDADVVPSNGKVYSKELSENVAELAL